MDFLSQWSQIVLIFFLSIFKYGFGIFTAVNSTVGFWPSIIANLIGGAIGVLLFIHFGYWIKRKYYEIKYRNRTYHRFSNWNKFLVRFKRKFGLIGISFFAPILLTIPVGVMLALQITEKKKTIFIYLYSGCILWSAIIYILDHFLHTRLFDLFSKLFP